MKSIKKSLLAILITAVICSFGFTACNDGYDITSITPFADLGEYNGYYVEIWHLQYNHTVDSESVPLYVGETYICTLPDASYKVIVYVNGARLDIKYAYNQNYITDEHLPEIAERAQTELSALDIAENVPSPVEGLTMGQVLGIRDAYYYELSNASPRDKSNIEILHYLGTFNHNCLFVILRYIPEGHGVAEVEIPVYINDTYICTLPDPSYKIVTCPSYFGGCSYLQESYDRKNITDEELLILAERAQIALGERGE